MAFELSLCKRDRTCSVCGRNIIKGTRHFFETYWIKDAPYPTKKNYCNECIQDLTSELFISYLQGLLSSLTQLKSFREKIVTKKDVPF
jgi:hypothetical protein